MSIITWRFIDISTLMEKQQEYVEQKQLHRTLGSIKLFRLDSEAWFEKFYATKTSADFRGIQIPMGMLTTRQPPRTMSSLSHMIFYLCPPWTHVTWLATSNQNALFLGREIASRWDRVFDGFFPCWDFRLRVPLQQEGEGHEREDIGDLQRPLRPRLRAATEPVLP